MAVEEMTEARSNTFELSINIFMLLHSRHQQEAWIHIKLQGGQKAIHEKQKNKFYLKTQCSISE
jgi:hypothetical protein